MKQRRIFLLSLIILSLSSFNIFAQVGEIEKPELSKAEADQIIQKVISNEGNFRDALTGYVFDRNVVIQTIGLGGLITGTYHRDSFMSIKDSGKRLERIKRFPISTLKITVTPEDIENLGGVNPFAINPENASVYSFTYVGKQKIDEIYTHVFDVRPNVNPKKTDKIFFLGKIWVDARDLMIVRSKGKGYPEPKKQKFPIVETWRANVDGKYWFPAYSFSDDELVFDSGEVIKLRIRVRYENYSVGRTEVIILDDDGSPDESVIIVPKEKQQKTPPLR